MSCSVSAVLLVPLPVDLPSPHRHVLPCAVGPPPLSRLVPVVHLRPPRPPQPLPVALPEVERKDTVYVLAPWPSAPNLGKKVREVSPLTSLCADHDFVVPAVKPVIAGDAIRSPPFPASPKVKPFLDGLGHQNFYFLPLRRHWNRSVWIQRALQELDLGQNAAGAATSSTPKGPILEFNLH